MLTYIEAFVESSDGCRYKLFTTGEGSLCIEYQEFNEKSNKWKKHPNNNIGLEYIDDIIKVMKLIKEQNDL